MNIVPVNGNMPTFLNSFPKAMKSENRVSTVKQSRDRLRRAKSHDIFQMITIKTEMIWCVQSTRHKACACFYSSPQAMAQAQVYAATAKFLS